jgi:hypothetical protein
MDQQIEVPTILWANSYYDGPISGIANYKNRQVWFETDEYGGWELINDVKDIKNLTHQEQTTIIKYSWDDNIIFNYCKARTYNIYRLSQDEINFELEYQKMVSKYIGNNHIYDNEFKYNTEQNYDTFNAWFKNQNRSNYAENNEYLGTFSELEMRKSNTITLYH